MIPFSAAVFISIHSAYICALVQIMNTLFKADLTIFAT